jgi:hypothetical protein
MMSNISYLDKARERRRTALARLDTRTAIRSREEAQPLHLLPADISDAELQSLAA